MVLLFVRAYGIYSCAAGSRQSKLSVGADASLAARDGLTPEAWARAHAGDCGSVLESVFTGQNG